jgi:hypothetical protein
MLVFEEAHEGLVFFDREFERRFEDFRFAGMVEAEDDGAVGRESGAVIAAVLNGFDLDDEGTVFLPPFRGRRIQLDDVREIFSFPGFLGDFDRERSPIDDRYRSGGRIGKFLQNFANKRAQVFQTVRFCSQQHHGNGEVPQFLLLGNFPIDGDQDVELVLGEPEQIAVFDPSPSAALNGRDRMGR